jgi:uncharacterized protein with HEPN domain
MARRALEYLADMLEAIAAIRAYTRAGRRAFARNAMARDAVVARLLQIGEAVKGAQAAGLDLEKLEPGLPWSQISGMRDILSHQYWRTDAAIVWGVVEKDLRPLKAAAERLQASAKRRQRREK